MTGGDNPRGPQEDKQELRRLAQLGRALGLAEVGRRLSANRCIWWLLFIPGALLFIGSIFMTEINQALGNPFGEKLPWVRFFMMIGGGFMVIFGWPKRTRQTGDY